MSAVELQAAYEAWLHTECGLTYPEMADYTQQELDRLQLGYLIRERGYDGGGSGSTQLSKQKAKIRRGQERARREQFADLGFQ